MSLKIFSDIDDVLVSFIDAYKEKFKNDPRCMEDKTITRNVQQVLRTDKNFWLGLKAIRTPEIHISGYCTKRIIPKNWTRESLRKNNFPDGPIYQQYYQYGSKARLIKGRCNVLLDDSVSNFINCNLNGVPCLLVDTPFNRAKWSPIGRIYSLKQEEVESAYKYFMEDVFPNFKTLTDNGRKILY